MLSSFPRSYLIAGSLIVFGAIALGGWFFFTNDSPGGTPPPPAALLPPVTTAPPDGASSPQVQPTPPSTMPPYRGRAPGNLEADPIFLAQIPAEFYAKNQSQLRDLAEEIAKENSPRAWMEVARIKHFYNDDEGAADAYEYLNIIASGDPIPFYNLGMIYAYNLKEPGKALPKFQAAIQRDPRSAVYALGLANFYRDAVKNLPAAEQALLAAIGYVKTEPALFVSLALVYQGMNDILKAKEYYQKALATGNLNASERQAIERDLAALAANQ